MKGTISILDGGTFVTSDENGDIHGTPTQPHGFFALDTRFLSRWELSVNDQPLASLSIDDVNYFSKQFFLAPSTGTTYVDSPMSVVRKRSVSEGMREEIVVMNHHPENVDVTVHIDVGADFADLFEVKDALAKKGELYQRVEGNKLVLGYKRENFVRETWITTTAPNVTFTESSVAFTANIPGGAEWRAAIDVIPVVDTLAPARTAPLTAPQDGGRTHAVERPLLHSDWRPLERIYERSLEDLDALRLSLPLQPNSVLPAAGLPWFMSLFGRDSLITSYQALPFLPELAETTLRVLAGLQGRREDPFRDMEPGKILHEMRYGEMTAFEERPHSPYYGSADSTTLWIILLDEFERWSGREDFVRELETPARAAIEWIDRYGDRDGDGFQEYERRRADTGLDNQCWKDSWDSIRFANGDIAQLPRATCELQGYAYDAKLRAARMAREIWGDATLADSLESQAADLKMRFNRDFWMPDRRAFALALDKDKRKVDSLSSNIGHLLWSGIVDEDKAAACVEALMSPELFSGWGVRTMSTVDRGYNPIGYHVGTIWPHDNAIIAEGLRRYGYTAEAARVAGGILEAATFFNYRLPEAFAGYPRLETRTPVEYPTACSPQAWATGAPLMILRTVLGLEPRGALLDVNAHLPRFIRQIDISGLPGRWGRDDVHVDSTSLMTAALVQAANEAPGAVSELFTRMKERAGAGLSQYSGSVCFDIINVGSWRVMIDQGMVDIDHQREDVDVTLELSEPTLGGILHGDQNVQTAILSGRLKAQGDIERARGFAREFL